MKAFPRSILLCFLLLLFLFFQATKSNAQSVNIEPVYPPEQNDLYQYLIEKGLYGNDTTYVDGNVRKVNISFKELSGDDDEYGICPLSEQAGCTNFKMAIPISAKSGEIQAAVCGAGKDQLRGNISSGGNTTGKECNPEKDYFHEGHIYRLGVYDKKNAEGLMALAEFFVKHSMPWVQVVPQKEKGETAVIVRLWGRRPGGDGKNNYQIVVEGIDNGFKGEACGTVKDGSGKTFPAYQKSASSSLGLTVGAELTMVRTDFANFGKPFPPGKYVVKINERVNDSRPLGIAEGCEGGFTYMHAPLTISPNNPKAKNSSVGKIEYDPNESDVAKEFGLFGGARAICAEYDAVNNRCNKVNTALGGIGTTPQEFIKTIFQFILVLAAFGAIIIIIYSGYILITSAGNKERIAAARETITSAVVGLLFIIFSIVILEIIGVDILRIPDLFR